MNENDIINPTPILPHSIEAEQSILGAIISNPNVMADVIELIRPEYFYNDQHKALYSVLVQMNSLNQPIDIVTVLNASEKMHIFSSPSEGRKYLTEIGNMLPSTSNIKSYCKIVADKYCLRCLSHISQTINDDIQYGEQDAQILLDAVEQQIYDIRQGKDIRGVVPLSEAIAEAYDELGKITGPDREKYLGAKTGFSLLDSITSGLNRSDLIIIAARPGMGKTSFAMNIATNVARHYDKEVVTFNLEMSKKQIATRILSTESLVESNALRNGRIAQDDWIKLATSAGYLSSLPLFIDDTANITVQQIKAKLRRFKNLGLVVIDYLQLIGSTSRTDNRNTIVGEITRQLKIMAKELNVPVILLSQLSRGPEGRTDKRPMMSDLRDSGSIEQDADIILFLYKDAYYNRERVRQTVAECEIAKNRHGETGVVKLLWDGPFTRFSNLDISE